MRELYYEDLLFKDYIETNSSSALEELIKSTNNQLFSIVVSFVFDSDMAEDILDAVYDKFVSNCHTYDITKYGIIYYIYLEAKPIIRTRLNETNRKKAE